MCMRQEELCSVGCQAALATHGRQQCSARQSCQSFLGEGSQQGCQSRYSQLVAVSFFHA